MVEHLVHFALNDIHSQACMVLLGEQDLHAALELLQQSAALLPEGIESWRADKLLGQLSYLHFSASQIGGKYYGSAWNYAPSRAPSHKLIVEWLEINATATSLCSEHRRDGNREIQY